MTDQDLTERLAVFEPCELSGLKAARRPAGRHLLVEFEMDQDGEANSLADFWLASLWRFLDDSRQNTEAFEGLAFQALAERLSPRDFEVGYGPLRAQLTLPPANAVELKESYRLLNGRLRSFAGVTSQGRFWAGFFQADVYEL
jgi:hypothetical protein